MRHVTVRRPGATSTPKPRGEVVGVRVLLGLAAPRTRLVTRQLQRAADDGYRNPLVPGLKATADAERLAVAVTQAAIRLLAAGAVPADRREPDLEQATWLAFLFALAPELRDVIAETRPAWEDADARRAARGQGQDRRGLPRLGRARRLAGGRLHRRGDLEPGAPLRPRLRAARAARLHPRHALRPAGRARRRRHLPARGRRGALRRGRRDDARRQAPARLRRPDAARAPRARPGRRLRAADRRVRPRPRRSGARRPSTST